MPNVDRKWLPVVLIGLAAVASLIAYRWLPSMVDLRLGGLLPFDTPTEDPLPRWLAVSLMPVVALIVWTGFRIAPTAAAQRVARVFIRGPEIVTSPDQFKRFARSYDTIVLAVVMLLLGGHVGILAAALGYPEIAVRTIPATLGLCLVLMGNVMPRLRPNWVAGVRTSRTLANPQLWRTTHRAFGTAFVAAGVLTIVATIVAPRYALLTGIAGLAVSCLVGLVASLRPVEPDRSGAQ